MPPSISVSGYSHLDKKGDKKEGYLKQIVVNEVKAPIKKGQVVGQVVIKNGDAEVAKFN